MVDNSCWQRRMFLSAARTGYYLVVEIENGFSDDLVFV
jgi:hypothetical protein